MIEHVKYLFVLFPVIGIGAFVGGLAYRRRLKAKVAGYKRIQGSVVENVTQLNFGLGATEVYLPVVEYFVGNSCFKVTGGTGYSSPIKTGTPLAVMLDPADPSKAFVEKGYYLSANILLLIGGGFMSLGSFLAYALFR